MAGHFGHIKALAFDAYGTLFNTHSVIATCEALFPGNGDALSRLWRSKQLEYTWLISLMEDYQDFGEVTSKALRFSCNSLGLTLDRQIEQNLMNEYLKLEPFPDTRPALKALAGYRLTILSNGSPSMLEKMVANAEL
ncbi:MAG: haloacid dehalogenase type II, partial [Chloroflexi bacterium]|nr:haloacid dehalogenase type II [Chloroflexota bacterium]